MSTGAHIGRGIWRKYGIGLGRQTYIAWIVTYLAYVVAARIGQSLILPSGVSPIWPASGVALAMVLRYGPAASIAVFAGNITNSLIGLDYIWVTLLLAFAAALEPLVSSTLLRRWFDFDSRLLRVRDIVMLMVVGAPSGSLIASLLSVMAIANRTPLSWDQLFHILETFWFGNAGGILMLTTPLLVWMQRPMSALVKLDDPSCFIEAVVIFVLLLSLVLELPFSTAPAFDTNPHAIAFLCFPLIAWASIRLDLRLSTAIAFLASVEAIMAAHWSIGLFRQAEPADILFNIQLFVLSLNVTNQLLGGLAQQERQATAQLTEREEFLSLAVHASNDGLFDFDRSRRRVWLSPRWKEQLGYRDHELSNNLESWRYLLLPQDRRKAIAMLKALDRGTAQQGECILRMRHRSGKTSHILCRVAIHRRTNGRIDRIVGTHTDISSLVTARQELEHQTTSLSRLARDLNQQRRLAEAANESKTNLLATVSHEVRTPLSGIIGMLSLLADNNLTEDQHRQVTIALSSAEDMLTILNDILDVTRLEAGRVALDTTDCDIHALIEGVVALFSGRSAGKGVSLSAEIAGNVPHFIRADQSRLRQILMNLVSNAVKFTFDGDIVLRVTTAPMTRIENAAGDIAPTLRFYLMIDVIDTGIGIPQDKIDQLFDRFQQADPSITRRFGGSGLGLTICKQLIDLMGGQISVESRPGFGSTFHVVLPTALGQSPEEQSRIRTDALNSVGTCRVLVVEDNTVNSALAREMLTRAGHSVIIVDNGSAALAELARGQFDVVLMDVQMPEMDGITTTQWIRSLDDRRAHIPIIALTADTMSGSRERYLTAGFSDYLEKPVRANKLIETIARHVATRRPARSEELVTSTTSVIPDDAAELDLQHLETLRHQMGSDDMERMISNMEAEFDFELRRLKNAVGLGDWEACHLALRALSDDAIQVGAVGLAKYSRKLLASSRDIETIFATVSQLQLTITRAVAQLRCHITDVSMDEPN